MTTFQSTLRLATRSNSPTISRSGNGSLILRLGSRHISSQQLDRIELLSEQIADLESSTLDIAQPLPEFRRLLKIPGIGKALALTIFYEVGQASRFSSVRRFSSYCRLVPGIAQSGSTSRRGRASKQGIIT